MNLPEIVSPEEWETANKRILAGTVALAVAGARARVPCVPAFNQIASGSSSKAVAMRR
jgi:hypothetical protein